MVVSIYVDYRKLKKKIKYICIMNYNEFIFFFQVNDSIKIDGKSIDGSLLFNVFDEIKTMLVQFDFI